MTNFPFSIATSKEGISVVGMVRYTNIDHRHTAGFVEADNRDEAYGKAMRIAKQVYPSSEGWKPAHVVIGSEFPINPDEPIDVSPA